MGDEPPRRGDLRPGIPGIHQSAQHPKGNNGDDDAGSRKPATQPMAEDVAEN